MNTVCHGFDTENRRGRTCHRGECVHRGERRDSGRGARGAGREGGRSGGTSRLVHGKAARRLHRSCGIPLDKGPLGTVLENRILSRASSGACNVLGNVSRRIRYCSWWRVAMDFYGGSLFSFVFPIFASSLDFLAKDKRRVFCPKRGRFSLLDRPSQCKTMPIYKSRKRKMILRKGVNKQGHNFVKVSSFHYLCNQVDSI